MVRLSYMKHLFWIVFCLSLSACQHDDVAYRYLEVAGAGLQSNANSSGTETTRTAPNPALTNTPNPTVTPTPTVTPKPSITPSPTITPTPTVTPSPTITPTPTVTPSPTITPTPTVTPSPTITPTPTVTPSPTTTPDPSPIGQDAQPATCADISPSYYPVEKELRIANVSAPLAVVARKDRGIALAFAAERTSISQYDTDLNLLNTRMMSSSRAAWGENAISFNEGNGKFFVSSVYNPFAGTDFAFSLQGFLSSSIPDESFGPNGMRSVYPGTMNEIVLSVASAPELLYGYKHVYSAAVVVQGPEAGTPVSPTGAELFAMSYSGQLVGAWPYLQPYTVGAHTCGVLSKPLATGALFVVNCASKNVDGVPTADLVRVSPPWLGGVTVLARNVMPDVDSMNVTPEGYVVLRGMERTINGKQIANKYISPAGQVLSVHLQPRMPQGLSTQDTITYELMGLGTPKKPFAGTLKFASAMVTKSSRTYPGQFPLITANGKSTQSYYYYEIETKVHDAQGQLLPLTKTFCIRTEKNVILSPVIDATPERQDGQFTGKMFYTLYRYESTGSGMTTYSSVYSVPAQY